MRVIVSGRGRIAGRSLRGDSEGGDLVDDGGPDRAGQIVADAGVEQEP